MFFVCDKTILPNGELLLLEPWKYLAVDEWKIFSFPGNSELLENKANQRLNTGIYCNTGQYCPHVIQ